MRRKYTRLKLKMLLFVVAGTLIAGLAGLFLLRHWRLVAELRYGFHVKVRDIVHH